MIGPLDPFALEFDSITPDPALAPRTLDDPFLLIAGARPAPATSNAGFTLIDDAQGRFAIDHETGIVTVASDDVLAQERGSEHDVRVRVIEHSGASYEMKLRLRLSGRVPQVAGADDFAAIAALPQIPGQETPPPTVAFAQFEACRGVALHVAELGAEGALYGALLDAPPYRAPHGDAALTLNAAPPAPASAFADWSV